MLAAPGDQRPLAGRSLSPRLFSPGFCSGRLEQAEPEGHRERAGGSEEAPPTNLLDAAGPGAGLAIAHHQRQAEPPRPRPAL